MAARTRKLQAPANELPDEAYEMAIERAMKCGYIPEDIQRWKNLDDDDVRAGRCTLAERVLLFTKKYLVVPEGALIGQPLVLDDYQAAFVYAVFDAPVATKKAILSVARRNGKTLVIGAILWSFLVGPLVKRNSVIALAAMAKKQAALAYRLMILMAGPLLAPHFRTVPSQQQIVGLKHNVELHTLSREAKTGHGMSIRVLLLDEAGQIESQTDDYLDMLFSSQGSYDDSITFIISTQAPTDAAFLSIEIDAATREQPEDTVCHVYHADQDASIEDSSQWIYANPGLGKFNSLVRFRKQVADTKAMPSKQTGFKNLHLNQRITQEELAFPPEVWRRNNKPPVLEVFHQASMITLGLDLSQKTDLTAGVFACTDDDGYAHLIPYCCCPADGLHQRSIRDKTPYEEWVKAGILYTCPGSIVDYEWFFTFLRKRCEEMGFEPTHIAFDRYKIEQGKKEALRAEFATNAEWIEIGQGFVSMGQAIDRFEEFLMRDKIRHGDNPALNASAMTAVVATDPAGNRKLMKADGKKGAHAYRRRIDPLVAALMAVSPLVVEEAPADVSAWIG